ncbi:MAG: TonB-dependent siderophore receptor [Nostoc sp.]|uniref:TonB-dependent siderophore receptor n=1 Tax=Nostoc sp. TaxID=1180 RepID=UPI002FF24311
MALEKLSILFWRSLLFTASIVAYTLPVRGQETQNAIDKQPLPQQTAVNQVEATPKIHSLSDVQSAKTSATYLLLTPREKNSVSQISQATTNVVSVTDVKVNTTDKGIEIILVTPNSEKLSVSGKTEGNSYVADIKNARLQLVSEEGFRQEKPVTGIASVIVTPMDANTLRLTVTGDKSAPVVELFDSQTEGLVFEVSTTASTAQQQTTPQARPTTTQKQPAIELDVTAPPETGYQVNNTNVGTRTDTPLRDIPQTINVVPRQVIEDQASQNLGDILRNLGIGNAQDTSREIDSAVIRGFTVRSDNGTLNNGLRDAEAGRAFGSNLNNIERVEVLKGPASVLYGQLPPGGAINLVTKQPLSDPYYSLGFKIGSYSEYEPSLDFSGPLTADRSLLYRFNASYKNSGSFVDFQNIERIFVAPVITWQPSSSTKLTIEGDYQNTRLNPEQGLPTVGTLLPNPNGKVPRSLYVGEPTVDGARYVNGRIGYNFEQRLGNNWSLNNAFRFSYENNVYYNSTGGSLGSDDRTYTRRVQSFYPFVESNFAQDTHVFGKVYTGSLEHKLLFGVDYTHNVLSNFGIYNRTIGSLDIFNPVYGQIPGPTPPRTSPYIKIINEDLGFYFQDQLSLANNLKLVLGGREDFVSNGNSASEQSDSAFSPRVGIVYQAFSSVSFYASYSSSFEQQTGVDFNNNIFKPTRGSQYEVGVKTDWLNDKLSAILSLYDLTKSNILTSDPDPDHEGYSIQIGEQRSRGIELYITGEIATGWNVIGSYNYTDSSVTKDNTYKVGTLLPGVPKNSISLWTTYIIPYGSWKGFGGGVGINYVGDRQGDLENDLTLPSYVTTDAALYYRANKLQLGLNFKNIFDTVYYQSGDTSLVYPGDPFSVEATVKYQF